MSHFSPLIFVHIPKASGSTLTGILRKRCLEGEGAQSYLSIGCPDDAKAFRASPESNRAKYKVISGHFPYGLHTCLPNQEARYITMLREPVSRILSLYFYAANTPGQYMYDVINRGLTLDAIMEGNEYLEYFNVQTQLVGGVFCEWDDDEELLATAMTHLETRFDGFGLTERFDESLHLLSGAAPDFFTPGRPFSNLNITPHDPRRAKVSEKTIELIRSRNQLDIRLYEMATRLFESRLEANPPSDRKLSFTDRIRVVAQQTAGAFGRMLGKART